MIPPIPKRPAARFRRIAHPLLLCLLAALMTVAYADTPKRIVTLFQGATDTALALGLQPVGVVESWTQQPAFRYLRARLGQPTFLGLETQPDLEAIAWLRPDLIVGAYGRHHLIHPLLSRMAPTVIADQVYDFKALLHRMGEATQHQAEADRLLARWQQRVADFRRQMANKLGDRWPQTVSVISFRSDHARIYYGGFARIVLDELGFDRPATQDQDGWGIKLTSQESIPTMDADAIFIFMVESDPAVMRTYRQWTAHPLWKQLSAVRENQVYRVDPVTWNMGGGYLAANRMLDELYDHYGLSPNTVSRECPQC